MSRYSRYSHYREYDYDYRRPKAKSKVMGVCAGLAKQFGWDVTLVRIVAILSLLTFTIPTVFAYLVAGVLFY